MARSRRSSSAPESGWRGAWDRLSSRTQHLVCVAALLVLSLSFFAPVHFTSQSITGGDTVNWRAMAEGMKEYRAETGREPLWNPYAFGGMPGYMTSYPEAVPQLDDLLQELRSFAWPTSHFFVLLLGTYLLVVLLTGNKLAGVLSAAAYGLTTYLPIILTAGHNTKFIALCFVPWLVLTFAYAVRRPGLLASLFFAAALALNLRAGHVQITYYATFLIGIWWIAKGVAAWRQAELATFGKATGWLALGSLLGVMMVAQPYLVNAEYKQYTIRGAAVETSGESGLDLDYALRWSQGPGELITLAVADAFGGGGQTYWGPKPFTEGPHYIGGLVLLLAALALWRVRRAVTVGFGVAALLMTFFAMGRHFPSLNGFMFRYFPLFDAFRAPETWMSMVSFALAVLAGIGAAHVMRREPSAADAKAKTQAVYIASGAAVGVAALLLFVGPSLLSFEGANEKQQIAQQVAQQNNVSPSDPRVERAAERYLSEQRSTRRDAFRSDAQRTLLFVLVGAALLVATRRDLVPAWTAMAALALVVVVDLWGVDRRYFSDEDLSAGGATRQIQTYDFDRFLLERQREAGGTGHFRVLSLEGQSPMNNARPSYHFESLGGYHGAKLQRYQDFIDHVLRTPQGGLSETALDLMNARYVIARQQLPGTEVAYQGDQTGYYVLENPDAAPRGFFVGRTEVIASPEDTWARLRSPTFNPQETAILPAPLDAEVTPVDSASTTRVELQEHTPREIRWTVQTDAPRLFVASEVYYPAGWTATLDGETVPIRRVNYLLRGVHVPAGEHELVMRFDPPRHTASIWISGMATALVYGGIAGLLGWSYVRRRESDADDAEEGQE